MGKNKTNILTIDTSIYKRLTISKLEIMSRYRMTQTEYEERVRYLAYHLFAYPLLVLVSIYAVGSVIEILFQLNLNTPKLIFMAIGGVGYFVWYFKNILTKKK